MKKLFAILVLFAVAALVAPTQTHAQINRTVSLSKATLTSTDTSTATITADDYTRSFTVIVTKTSGTVAGKVYFYGSGDGTNFEKLDSLVLADVSGAQVKTFKPVIPLVYYQYKITDLQTGGTTTISAKQLTRRY
jgi:hypothetical protein